MQPVGDAGAELSKIRIKDLPLETLDKFLSRFLSEFRLYQTEGL
jgi:hypothetical protein